MDESEHDVLAFMGFPAPVEAAKCEPAGALDKEVKRRADMVGVFPNEASIIRLFGTVLLKQNDEWQLQHRYMQAEAMAESTPKFNANCLLEISPRAA